MSLPPPLRPLVDCPQWILWRLNGDVKEPINPHTGRVHNPHDPATWVTYQQAAATAPTFPGCALAFVITAAAGFWFLDIDRCREGDRWSQLAGRICGMLPGAAIEVSQSGNGLHLFGRGTIPPHSCKNTALKLEFYSDKRYVAVTGTGAVAGSAAADLSAHLPAVIAEFFPFGGDSDAGAAETWADQAVPEWVGPADDAELIRAMLSAKHSFHTVLTGKATVNDLWNGNAAVLARTYPPNMPGKQWDYSSADAALAQHLAFWTGKNTERIRRLMRQSKLVRDKWDSHRSYLWITISKACRQQKEVYIGRINGTAHPALAAVPLAPAQGEVVAGASWLATNQQIAHFAGCVYIRDEHRVFVPDGAMLKPEQFRAMYGGYLFSIETSNDKTTKSAWEVFTESQAVRFPKAEGICFRPENPPGAVVTEEGRRLVNTYVPIDTRRLEGDAGPFLKHLRKLLPDDRDRKILTAYLAALVQYPGSKFQWCPVIQGAEGNGKTVIISTISFCVGHRYSHLPNAGDLGDNGTKFNLWLRNKLFIGVEEITLAERQDILDALKPMVTNRRLDIQGKGMDQVTGDNRANFIMCCNAKDAIAVGVDKRRYAIFYTAQQTADDLKRDGMHDNYFPKLYQWLNNDGYAIVNDFLRTYVIPDELNPAVDLNPAAELHRAPATTSTAEMIELSLTPIEQEVLEAVGEGRRGFAGGWISSLEFDRLLQERGRAKSVPYRKRREILKSLGYDWHPHLIDGRTNNPVPGENGKPRLFLKIGHIAGNLTSGSEIVAHYLQAQGLIGAIKNPTAAASPGGV